MQLLPNNRLLKRLGIAAGLLIAITMIVNAVLAWRTDARLKDRIAAVRNEGDPASIAELAPEPVRDDENAAAYLASVQEDLAAFSRKYSEFYSTEAGKTLEQREKEGIPPTSEQIAAMRKILKEYPQVDAALKAAAACERYASLADFSVGHQRFLQSMLDATGHMRTASRFLDWRMSVDVAGGRQEEAVAQGIELLRLARLYDQEPGMVQFLVGIAVRGVAARSLYDALAAGPVPSELHAQLNEELVRHDDPERLVLMLKQERAISISGLDALAGQAGPLVARIVGWPIKKYQIGVLDFYEDQLKLLDPPWLEVQKRIGRSATPQAPSGHGALADLLVPAVRASHEAYHRNVAVLRALRIYSALVQYRDEHGQEASGLADLGLPDEVTRDPFSGESLKLKHTEKGWTIYTVWQNGTDDGGDFTQMKDWGLGPDH